MTVLFSVAGSPEDHGDDKHRTTGRAGTYTLTPSRPHTFTPSHPHTLTPSHPHTFTPFTHFMHRVGLFNVRVPTTACMNSQGTSSSRVKGHSDTCTVHTQYFLPPSLPPPLPPPLPPSLPPSLTPSHSFNRAEGIQADQILLRGAQLRNTTFIYGLVVYTGHDSKLLRNASRAPLKRSNMDNVTNRQVVEGCGVFVICSFNSVPFLPSSPPPLPSLLPQVIALVALLLLLSLISSIGATVWNSRLC